MTHNNNENTFSQSLTNLEKNLEVVVKSGAPRDISDIFSSNGTKHIHLLFVPNEITTIIIGSHMIFSKDEPVDFSLNDSSAICYHSHKTGHHVLWLDSLCKVVKGVYHSNRWIPSWNDSVFIINEPGNYQITFELVNDNDELFLLAYNEH